VNRRGQTITAAYDLLDRDSVVSAGGASTNYRYSPTDLWLAAWNAESTDTLKLDLAGRVEYEVTKRDSSYTLRSTYNKRGERTKIEMTAPSAWARSVSYGYLAHGGLGTLTAWGANTTLGFNDDRQATSFELPTTSGAKLTVNKAYSSSHMAGEVTYTNASAVNSAVGVRYAQDVMARITERRNVAMDSVRKFTYDKAGRLIRAQDFRWTDSIPANCYWDEGMSYQCDWGSPELYQLLASDTLPWDKVGNPADGTVQAGNRLTSYRGRTMQYDADGNMTQVSWSVLGVQWVRNLYWNPFGQLDSVQTTVGYFPPSKVSFGYDAFGRRVRKSVGSTTTRYVYDGDHVFTEALPGATDPLAEYAYYPGVDRPHSMRRWSGGTGTVYYYLTDHPGNVLGLVNASKQLVNEYRYTPFGEHELTSESVENRLRYAAREFDSETGLYYNRARYYDPVLRRFVSEDPIGLAGGINFFAYAANNPVTFVDPFGLWECGTDQPTTPPVVASNSSHPSNTIHHNNHQGTTSPIDPACDPLWSAALLEWSRRWDQYYMRGVLEAGVPGWLVPSGLSTKTLRGAFRLERHHNLPKEFIEFFRAARLDIEDFVVLIPRWYHRLKPFGIHTGKDNWNAIWQEFIRRNPGATAGEIMAQLNRMLDMPRFRWLR
jgi:RHS repeat-associated protein